MRYYVHAVDGQVYGPFDVPTLNQWVQEGRVIPTTLLQPETNDMRVAASTVQGIFFATNQTYTSFTPQVMADGKNELKASFVCFGASLVLCCFPMGFHILAGIFGIILGMTAYRRGHTLGILAMLLNLILLALLATSSLGWIPSPFDGLADRLKIPGVSKI